jgi:predicted PurR-regulated permease PerM
VCAGVEHPVIADREFTRRMVGTVFTVMAVAILVAVLWQARSALMLIYVSAIVAMGFSPIVGFIERPRQKTGARRIPHTFAILMLYLGILAAVAVVALMIVPPLIDQAGDLWSSAPKAFADFQRFLIRNKMMSLSNRVTLEEAVQNAPAGSGVSAINTVLAAIWSVIGGVFGVVTILILSFYLLVEGERMFEHVTRLFPEASRAQIASVGRESVRKVGAWLSAQLILAWVMGLFAAGGLWLIGVPYFYVVALVAAVGETIPIVGPIVAGISAVAIALSVSPKIALIVGAYFLVLHQLEANILVPKIMERRVGVSPVTVIVALLIGAELWGLVGAILAIPTAAILTVIVDELLTNAA